MLNALRSIYGQSQSLIAREASRASDEISCLSISCRLVNSSIENY